MGFEWKFYTGDDNEFQERMRQPNKETNPGAQRCNDRLEDLCRVVVKFGTFQQLQTAWRTAWDCLNSEQGQEPQTPYVMLTEDDPLWKEAGQVPWRRQKQAAQQQEQPPAAQTRQQQREQQQQQPLEQQQQQQEQQLKQQQQPEPRKRWWSRQSWDVKT